MKKLINILCEMDFILEGKSEKQIVVNSDDYRVSARNGVFVLINKNNDKELVMLPISRTTVSYVEMSEAGEVS